MITPRMHGSPWTPNGASHGICHEWGITINQPFNYEGRPIGYIIMSVQINGISGYNEDQVVLMACNSAEFHTHHVPIIVGTPTMD